MTTNYHTPIVAGSAANAATFNTRLADLDGQVTTDAGQHDADREHRHEHGSHRHDGELGNLCAGVTCSRGQRSTRQVYVLDGEIGDLTTLGTTPKTSIVAALGTATPTTSAKTVLGAINEMDAEIAVNTAAIGYLSTLGGGVSSYDSSLVAYIGTAILLTTAEKLAPAINEVHAEAVAAQAEVTAACGIYGTLDSRLDTELADAVATTAEVRGARHDGTTGHTAGLPDNACQSQRWQRGDQGQWCVECGPKGIDRRCYHRASLWAHTWPTCSTARPCRATSSALSRRACL